MTFICLGILAVLLSMVALTVWQRRLIYFPSSTREPSPPGFSEIALDGAEGRLIAWYRPATHGRPTLVLFNGNAGTLAGAVRFTEPLARNGFGLLLASYPGYDGNPGRPTEQGLYGAGRAALAWLAEQGLSAPVIIGWSLGGAVAVQMATEFGNSGVILFAPFTSAVNIAARRFPFMPVRRLMLDRFDNQAKLGLMHTPHLLILHGDADRVIPFAEGEALFAAAREPKRFIALAGAGHSLPMEAALAELESWFAAPQSQ